MDKIKQALFSENGMKLVNLLFLLSLLIPGKGIIFIAYLFWIAYLVCCIRISSSRAVRIVYRILIVFAAVMIVLNAYFMLKSM